jgi:predicted amidophosphoribosyltransferase
VKARSAALLRPPADDLVHALKYGGWPGVAAEMARAMTPLLEALRREAGGRGPTLLVPVPTTPRKERTRGYNQARILALALGARTGTEVADLLLRRGTSESQVALHREERMANVDGVFSVVPGSLERLPAAPFLVLIDDVLTTGATASAAATALGDAGHRSVHLLTYGRALPGREGGDPATLPPPGFFQTWLRTGRRPPIFRQGGKTPGP